MARCMLKGNDTPEDFTVAEMERLRAPNRGVLNENTDNLVKEDASSPAAGASPPGAG